jgi:sec-independent protein translocase protein TatA
MPIGIPELLIVLVVVLLIVGPKKLPGLGRQLGGGMREFKDAVTKRQDALDEDDDDGIPGKSTEQSRAELNAPPAPHAPAPGAEPVSGARPRGTDAE